MLLAYQLTKTGSVYTWNRKIVIGKDLKITTDKKSVFLINQRRGTSVKAGAQWSTVIAGNLWELLNLLHHSVGALHLLYVTSATPLQISLIPAWEPAPDKIDSGLQNYARLLLFGFLNWPLTMFLQIAFSERKTLTTETLRLRRWWQKTLRTGTLRIWDVEEKQFLTTNIS